MDDVTGFIGLRWSANLPATAEASQESIDIDKALNELWDQLTGSDLDGI